MAKTKKKAGRPRKLEHINLEMVTKYAMLGMTQNDIAFLLDVHPTTLTRNKTKEDFANAIKRGQQQSEISVTKALFDSARSGNVTAQIFWLCNRAKDKWKNVHKIEHSGDEEHPVKIVLQGVKKIPGKDT